MYYWQTVFHVDSAEQKFLQAHDVSRLYVRYFDVVFDESRGIVPNATISFEGKVPEGVEIVPTIYIVNECMRQNVDSLPRLILKRILQMNETNDIAGVGEIQIDCDYTSKSRSTYYDFLKEIRQAWGKTVSTTIRLHQLSMATPPADYGVLMIYNTGDPRKWEDRNPILDYRDVYPYLERLDNYQLPLAAAYPVYLWVRNIQGVRVEHTVEAAEILKVKKAMEKERPDLSRAIITYHLDKDNINRYKPKTYEEIYHH
jgi:hypothetical protein